MSSGSSDAWREARVDKSGAASRIGTRIEVRPDLVVAESTVVAEWPCSALEFDRKDSRFVVCEVEVSAEVVRAGLRHSRHSAPRDDPRKRSANYWPSHQFESKPPTRPRQHE